MHRYITSLGVALLALFGFALPALANTTNLSSDPSYAQAPFTFYCQPYKTTFVADKHYKPQTGPCVFSVPNTVPGSARAIAVYKGVPGTSVFVSGDQFFGTPTLIQEDVVTFGTPAQDQDYFAVVYGGTSNADITQFNNAFTTGSSTNTLLPSDNYRMIKWKWGGKPVAEYNPVVIIPDFTNSWVTDTGPVIDPIFKTYQNLTDTLVANGYVVNQNLFTFPYNWQDSLTTTAQALAAKIAAIKSTCGCTRVDIVAHGTGGLIALQYIKSVGYQNDVDQVITLGTPLLGAPAAYRALEAGQIMTGNALSDGLAQALLAQQAKDGGFTNIYAYIQSKPTSAFKDIVPAFTDYLLDTGFNPLTYPSGYPQNTFLENLLIGFNQITQKIRLNTVLADDQQYQTPAQFVVTTSTQPPLWPHGQPTQTLGDSGDGFITRSSIETAIGSANFEVTSAHNTIPTAAQSYIFNSLNNKNPGSVVNNNYPVSCVLLITTSAGTDLLITDPNNLRLGKNLSGSGNLNEIANSLYSGSAAATEYGVVANPVAGTYQVQTQGTTNGSFTINATDVCGNGVVVATSTTSTVTSGQILGFGLTVSANGGGISIASLDSNAPMVLITSPQQGQTYYQNDVTPLTVTITDPEGSPITATSYRLNNLTVTPGQPLPFSSVPVGTTTVTVSATDVYGNTAVATSTFLLLPPDYTKPKIKITNPLSYGLYTRSDVEYLTATITANAALATSSYWYDNKRINPAQPLPLSTASIGGHTVMVAATDIRGNSATSTLRFLVVGAKNSCIADIVAVLTDIRNKEYPDKPTIAQLLKDCAALLKNLHRNDDRRDRDDD